MPRAKRPYALESPPAVLPPGAPPASGSSVAPPVGVQWLAEGEDAQRSGASSGGEEGPEPTAVKLETFGADEDVVLNMQSPQEDAGAQSSGAALAAPASGSEEVFEPTEAELAAFLADEEVALEIQSLPNILGCPPTVDISETIANANVGRQRVLAHRDPEAVTSAPTPPDPEWLTAMFNSVSSAPPERSASAPRVTEPDKAAAAKAELEAKVAERKEWEAKKAAMTNQRLLLEQQRAVLQQRQRQQQQQKAMQRLEQQQRRQQQQQKAKNAIQRQRLLHQHPPAHSSSTSGSGTVQMLAGAAAAHALQQKQQK